MVKLGKTESEQIRLTLEELARRLECELAGGAGIVITGALGIDDARPGDITFADSNRLLARAEASSASAIIAPLEITSAAKPLLRASNPRLAFARALDIFHPARRMPEGVHPTAVVGDGAVIGSGVAVGAHAVLGDRVRLGDRVQVHPLVFLGDDVCVGEDTIIYPLAAVREGVAIGARCIIHCGVVLGADGFGYTKVGRTHHKIPQVGKVRIGDDVEIGALVAIDRATTGETVIGSGTKIDNLVQIGHNTKVGENCIIVAQTGLSGSVNVGDDAVLAAQVGVADHVGIGGGAVALARAGITQDVRAGAQVSGFPARPHREELRVQAEMRRLPHLTETVRDLRRRLSALEAKIRTMESGRESGL
jgi:UDP-3-O-[3-hydroxymyristoyl] glucosamine N-acyltransferase